MDLESDNREASYQELVSLGGATPLGPMSPRTKPKISRPPSYSDSFIVLGSASTPALPSISPYREDISSWANTRSQIKKTPIVAEKGLSILLHVVLISLFETVFYFQFVSQSEDAALMKTVDGILDGTVRGCQQWPANVTQDINYILDLLVNVSEISAAGSVAGAARARDNTSLQIQSWIYTASLTASLLVSLSAFKIKGWKINWRVLLGENLALIVGLGLYEFMFFKTIVYNYSALTVPEIDARVVEQLEQSCGLFH
jgi:hypothetical protein